MIMKILAMKLSCMYVVMIIFIGVLVLLSTTIMAQSKHHCNNSILHCIFLWKLVMRCVFLVHTRYDS